MATGDLITLQRYKDANGLTDNTQDTKITEAISDASDIIRQYLERDVGLPLGSVGEVRTYNYDGLGILEIDDVAFGSITSVMFDSQTLTADSQYRAFPDKRSPVQEWLQLIPGAGVSPAMGFTWNADTLYSLYGQFGAGLPINHRVAVTATFGWPVVPNDIQRATIWVVAELLAPSQPVQSRHFESYSEQFALHEQDEAIPGRAKALLDPWMRRKL